MPVDPSDKSAKLADERAKLWALWYGFQDTEEQEEWDEQAKGKRLAELNSKKGVNSSSENTIFRYFPASLPGLLHGCAWTR